jgi:hypothetical protein
MIEAGELDPLVVSEVEYDVFKKPGIRPKRPAKKDVEVTDDGFIYYGQSFEGGVPDVETGIMFGVRLYADIQADSFKYFARRPIAILARDIKSIENELYNLYKLISYCKKNNFWDVDPYSCSQPFKCEYRPLCDEHINPDVDTLPDTYTRGW